MEERASDWDASQLSVGKGEVFAEGRLVVLGKEKSWASRSRSDLERSSMKFICFCMLDFLGMDLVDFLNLISALILMMRSVGFVGVDSIDFRNRE